MGIPIACVGILYMLTIGKRLIPQRAAGRELTEDFGLGPYLSEVVVQEGSKLAGKTLDESGFGRDLDLTVVRVIREGRSPILPQGDTVLREGDVLIVEGNREEILKIKDTAGLDIRPGRRAVGRGPGGGGDRPRRGDPGARIAADRPHVEEL